MASYRSFNSLKARVISLLTVYYNGEVCSFLQSDYPYGLLISNKKMFLAHLAKDNVSFWQHLASIVR
jgi:hypothetical protein